MRCDAVQMTALGKIVAGVCAVAGISFFALPAVRLLLSRPAPPAPQA